MPRTASVLIDTALSEPGIVEKHGRPILVVLSVKEYERLQGAKRGFRVEKRNAGGVDGATPNPVLADAPAADASQ